MKSILRLLFFTFALGVCAAHAQSNAISQTAAGTLIGKRTTDAIGFHGTAPTAQRSGSAQAAVTKTTGAALTGTLTGTANGSLVDVAATAAATAGGSSPTAAEVDTGIATAVASIVTGVNEQNKELQARVNQLVADNDALVTLVNELRAALVAKGFIKGSN